VTYTRLMAKVLQSRDIAAFGIALFLAWVIAFFAAFLATRHYYFTLLVILSPLLVVTVLKYPWSGLLVFFAFDFVVGQFFSELRFSGELKIMVVLLLVVSAVSRLVVGPKTLRLPKSFINPPMLLFLTIGLESGILGWMHSNPPRSLQGDTFDYILVPLFFFSTLGTVRTRRQAYAVLSLSSLVLFYPLARDLLAYRSSTFQTIGVWIGELAVLRRILPISSVMLFPLFISLYLHGVDRKIKAISGLLALLTGACLILSFTRGYWLGSIAGMFFLLLFSKKKRQALLTLTLIGIIMLVGTSLYTQSARLYEGNILGKLVINHFSTLKGLSADESAGLRLQEAKAALETVASSPIIGLGQGAEFDNPIPGLGKHYTHNAYLAILLRSGVIGLLAYGWLAISFVTISVRGYRELENELDKGIVLGIVSAFVAASITSLSSPMIITVTVSEYLGCWMGLAFVIIKARKPEFITVR